MGQGQGQDRDGTGTLGRDRTGSSTICISKLSYCVRLLGQAKTVFCMLTKRALFQIHNCAVEVNVQCSVDEKVTYFRNSDSG